MGQNPQFPADLVTFTEKSLMNIFTFCAVDFRIPLQKLYLLYKFDHHSPSITEDTKIWQSYMTTWR